MSQALCPTSVSQNDETRDCHKYEDPQNVAYIERHAIRLEIAILCSICASEKQVTRPIQLVRY